MLEAARALIDRAIASPPENDDDPPGIALVGNPMEMLNGGTANVAKENATA